MKLVLASDHAGVELRKALAQKASELGWDVEDLGPEGTESVNYPDYAHRLARTVAQGQAQRGVLVCGTGIGMSITANKHRGIRAALVTEPWSAAMTRAHNDANVLCLGARVTGLGVALACLEAFLNTEFEGGRHQIRVAAIEPEQGEQ